MWSTQARGGAIVVRISGALQVHHNSCVQINSLCASQPEAHILPHIQRPAA
jgi:hypothetical protein